MHLFFQMMNFLVWLILVSSVHSSPQGRRRESSRSPSSRSRKELSDDDILKALSLLVSDAENDRHISRSSRRGRQGFPSRLDVPDDAEFSDEFEFKPVDQFDANDLRDEGFLEALYDPSRQFNIDESGFSLSPKQGKVLAIRGEKHVFEESAIYHKTNITVLANVCADGRIPPPLIIYPHKRITANMAEHFPENYDCCVGKSESGYITFETLYEYLCNSLLYWQFWPARRKKNNK